MLRALQLAKLGEGNVSPNPMVGAVVVAGGRIIGEGFHRRYGEAHAEVNAIGSVADSDLCLLKDSTLYVTLEPCSHYGKTPPCSRLIIDRQIPRVVVGCMDPFKAVSGRGVKMLREAGCDVVTGVLEDECRKLNEKFMTAHTLHRPYILLKWAESSDGYIDKPRTAGQSPVKFSTAVTNAVVHKLRSEYDAVMVGSRTVVADNPLLTVRKWYGRNPVRIVLDRGHVVDSGSRIFSGDSQTIVFTKGSKHRPCEVVIPDEESDVLGFVCSYLYGQGITSLLVEGGSVLLQNFIDENLWDEIRVERSTLTLGDGVRAPLLPYGLYCGSERLDGNEIVRIKNHKTGKLAI